MAGRRNGGGSPRIDAFVFVAFLVLQSCSGQPSLGGDCGEEGAGNSTRGGHCHDQSGPEYTREEVIAVEEESFALQAAGQCRFPDFFADSLAELPECTTTTLTSTSTTRTFTETSAPSTTTTTPQPRECRDLCPINSHPWFVKCEWPVCQTCSACENIVVPDAEAPVEEAAIGDTSTAEPTTTTSTNVTVAATTTTSDAASDGTETSTSITSTTTTIDIFATPTTTTGPKTIPLYTCLSSCHTSTMRWARLCQYATCYLCPECDITTTSVTVTITATTTRRTLPQTTARSPENDGDTITTATETQTTSTSTTSITTTTSRTTRTTTTTSTPCAGPNAVFPTQDCRDNVAAGTTCVATALEHDCVQPAEFEFACPLYNTVYNREAVFMDGGNYSIRCQICGFAETELFDSDPRWRWLSTTLTFGPNVLDDLVNEAIVEGYEVYFADSCRRKLGPSVAYVSKRSLDDVGSHQSCCQPAAYTVLVEGELSEDIDFNVSLMVVPRIASGELSVGRLTDPIFDFVDNATIPAVADARQIRGTGLFPSLLLLLPLLCSTAA